MFDRRLWSQARGQIFPLLGAILSGALLGASIVVQAWLLSQVISGVFIERETLSENEMNFVLLAIVILLRVVFVFLREASAGEVSIRVRSELYEKLYQRVLQTSPVGLTGERTGEVISTIIEGVERLDAYFSTYLPQLGLAVIVPFTVLLVIFPLDWLTGLIFLLTAPLIPLFMFLIGKEAEKQTNQQWKLLGRLSGHFLDVLQGLRTLKVFGLSRHQGKVVRSVSEEYAAVTLGVLRIAFLSALTLELLATISTAVVAVQIGLRLMYARLDFASALFILILAPEFYFPLRQLGAAFHSGMDGIAAATSIFGLIENEDDQQEHKIVSNLPHGEDIRFEDVKFAYQDGARQSLRGVSFSIPAGKHTALIGPSGAGKSTIFSLLLGFIQPDEGKILVGDVPLDCISHPEWLQSVSWVSQFPYLFYGTVLENIWMARPDATEEEVFRAAKLANAVEFISGLPEGYATIIGERGARLSGGQGQRLAVARAFLRDSSLILLDEPASSLDPKNEEKIQEALSKLKTGRTVVTISHRVASIRESDLIIFLDEGYVKQTGMPTSLEKIPGPYRNLVMAAGGGK
ncbi:MAG: thiol reductant ABC exporter subunit CydD [Anaerolineales bacterium]|nr:thiol reductant ABC exporter subunit CydD [Anaerolineales bacterium]